MKIEFTEQFKENFLELPPDIQKKAQKALKFLSLNPRHPSLRIKRIQGGEGEMEGRIDRRHRFVFVWIPEGVLLMACGPHKIVEG